MGDDFFLGFAAHAHTMNELELDPQKELELRRRNSPEEARRLAGKAIDRLEQDLLRSGCRVADVKLLVLYLSYRGDPAERDAEICGAVLDVIDERLRARGADQLRLIGHTTGGEVESEDEELQQVSGVGFNGLSLLALATSLPVGVGRTWGLRTPSEAGEQGREMARDAWVDFSQQATCTEHLRVGKTLLVLTQGSKVDTPGYEHFLAEGIAAFMGGTREARIVHVIGGSSGDGLTAKRFHQFYGRLKEHSLSRVLDGEAVCALIPNLRDVSVGLDGGGITKVGRQHMFHFDSKKEPHFKYVKRIGTADPCTKFADVIYDNEVKLSQGTGVPAPPKEAILEAMQLSREQKRLLIFNPVVARYAFAFPYGNYACVACVRVVDEGIELMFPIRSYTPEMPGYIMMGHPEMVQKGARRVQDMLRADQGFSAHDTTLVVTCINRRLVELMAGCRSGTEAEILKEGLSPSQVFGFLAYGELSFTHLMQEPYSYGFSCWGVTLHARTTRAHEAAGQLPSAEALASLPDRVATGYSALDTLLRGGIPATYAVVLAASPSSERESLVRSFLQTGAEHGEATFYVTVNPGAATALAAKYPASFHLLVCNPQADAIVKPSANTSTLKGVENLTAISIALTSAVRRLGPASQEPRRICLGLVSDVLLQHHAVQTRKWLTALTAELKANGFTTLAVVDPQMHPPEELHAVLGLLDGEVSIGDKASAAGLDRVLKVMRLTDQPYVETELLLKKGEPPP